uniref:Uncharacterized protein n=1 Tax=Vitis vinifera TaxID=29760 RepID=F6HTW3_VITVI
MAKPYTMLPWYTMEASPQKLSNGCHQVINVDEDGRKMPIISFNPNHNTEPYSTKTETVKVEQVHAPS